MFFPLAMLSQYVFGPALFLLSLFIVLIILLQRGRGGGLTGALGGAGGASAFGVKAGDIFTRITAVAVLLWIVLCALTCFWYLPDSLDITANSSSKAESGMGGLESLPLELSPTTTPELDAKPAASDGAATEKPGPVTPAIDSATLPPAATTPFSADPKATAPALPPAVDPAVKPTPEPPVTADPPVTEPLPATEPASTEPASTEPKP